MRRFRGASKGFTLIEILVAIAVLGILAAVAIPFYHAYRKRGFIAAIKSDLKNASIIQEGYYTEFQTYTASLPTLVSNGFRQSSLVNISITSGGQTYTLSATHASCGSDVWTFNGTGSIIDPATPCQ